MNIKNIPEDHYLLLNKHLNQKEKRILFLRYFKKLSYKDIAEELGDTEEDILLIKTAIILKFLLTFSKKHSKKIYQKIQEEIR